MLSLADNLVAGDTNGKSDIFVHDRQTGATERVSVDSAGNQGDGPNSTPAISGDGRFVAFYSYASNLVAGDTNTCPGTLNDPSCPDVFVHDRQTGVTERVSVDSAGNQANGQSVGSAISADGRFVAFLSLADNLVAGDTNGFEDIFVHDRQTGATERVTVNSSGGETTCDVPPNLCTSTGAISADGRFVTFSSKVSNLVAGDTNADYDIFVHDRQTGATTRVSVDSGGNEGNSSSFDLDISGDGRFVAFDSFASNLVAGDTNGHGDVFFHDLGDADGDGEWDSFDNCTAVPNAGQTDTDGDGLGNACDNCPAWANGGQALPPWPVTLDGSDPDCDGWTTSLENVIGTDPNDSCGGDSTWPPNISNALPSTDIVDIFDVLELAPPVFFSAPPSPNYNVRKDLTAGSQLSDPIIDIFDVLLMAPPIFFATCTP